MQFDKSKGGEANDVDVQAIEIQEGFKKRKRGRNNKKKKGNSQINSARVER